MVIADIITDGETCLTSCEDDNAVFDFVDSEGAGNKFFIYYSTTLARITLTN